LFILEIKELKIKKLEIKYSLASEYLSKEKGSFAKAMKKTYFEGLIRVGVEFGNFGFWFD
jgi:hypothetical protein